MNAREWNFDGLVGPTHHYGGLSLGNVASLNNAQQVSRPRAAALQGLKKMWTLHQLGIPQGVLPPHPRPHLQMLKQAGFTGTPEQILLKASEQAPELLSPCYSSSAMWTANAGTLSPSPDHTDQNCHITPANLHYQFHRSLEPAFTAELLQKIFPPRAGFVHHPFLPAHTQFGDEGAANHTRLCSHYGKAGLHFFVYGNESAQSRFPARQTHQASRAIARQHGLSDHVTVFAQQTPEAVDAGVFHNDVISVGNLNVLLLHEQAYVNQSAVVAELQKKFRTLCGEELILVQATVKDFSLQDAVQSYIFNSQLVTLADGSMALICPDDCQAHERVHEWIQRILADTSNPIQHVHFLPLRESMNNGGGPACLRLRVVLNDWQESFIHQPCILTETLYHQLCAWVEQHYREQLTPADLADPKLYTECKTAFAKLGELLKIDMKL